MSEWTTITVVVDPPEVDLVSGLAWEFGVSGIEERLRPDGKVELRLGCEARFCPRLVTALDDRWSTTVDTVSAHEGLDTWREFAEVYRVGSTVVVPAWLEIPPDAEDAGDVLLIDPGHAFGSASHETTRLCLAAVTEFVVPGVAVADIGCGSGILSVAAARRGAATVTAIDIAPDAVLTSIANAERNGVLDRVDVSDTPVAELVSGTFDLVVANIGAATLCALAEDLVRCSRPSGILVLSGVLDEQVDGVIDAFRRVGARCVEVRDDGEWRALVLEMS